MKNKLRNLFKLHRNENIRSTRKRQRGWTTPGKALRDMSHADRATAMAKARQKAEESPVAAGIIQTMTDNIVGRGYALSMQTKDPGWNREVEKWWMWRRDRLDVRGLRTWGQLQRMWFKRKFIDGDVGIWLVGGVVQEDGILSTRVQTIEADRIGNPGEPQSSGITYDRWGKPIKFRVIRRGESLPEGQDTNDPNISSKSTSVDGRDFVYYAHWGEDRAEQERGVSQMLQSLNVLQDLERTIENMGIKVKNEAMMGIKFTLENGGNDYFGTEITEDKKAEDGKTRKQVKMVDGMNLNLLPGEDASPFESKHPGPDWVPFVRFSFRYAGLPFGLPLEILMLDLSDTNFSGGRAVLELAKRRFRIEQQDLKQPSSRIFNWALAREMKNTDILKPPAELDMPWAHLWRAPQWPYLDPQKEVQARGLELSFGLNTRGRILAEDGFEGDFEDLVDEIARENAMAAEKGVSFTSGMPGLESNNSEPQETVPDE